MLARRCRGTPGSRGSRTAAGAVPSRTRRRPPAASADRRDHRGDHRTEDPGHHVVGDARGSPAIEDPLLLAGPPTQVSTKPESTKRTPHPRPRRRTGRPLAPRFPPAAAPARGRRTPSWRQSRGGRSASEAAPPRSTGDEYGFEVGRAPLAPGNHGPPPRASQRRRTLVTSTAPRTSATTVPTTAAAMPTAPPTRAQKTTPHTSAAIRSAPRTYSGRAEPARAGTSAVHQSGFAANSSRCTPNVSTRR